MGNKAVRMGGNGIRIFFRRHENRGRLFILIGSCILIMIIIQTLFLSRFYGITRNNLEDSTANILSQIEENMSAGAGVIIRNAEMLAYNTITQTFLSQDNYQIRAEYSRYVKGIMAYMTQVNPGIQDICLRDNRGRYINQSPSVTVNYLAAIDGLEVSINSPSERGRGQFYLLALPDALRYVYILPFPLFGDWNSTAWCYIVFDNKLFGNTSLSSMMRRIKLPENSVLLLVNNSGDILASSHEEFIGSTIDEDLRRIIVSADTTVLADYRKQNSMIKSHTIVDMGWTLISIVPMRDILKPINTLIILGYLLGLLLLLGLWFLIRKSLNVQTELYRADLAKKEAEFRALQSRINPHFLYNTLDCIRVIAYTRNVQEIVSITSAMAKMFRYAISKDNTVTVAEELACISDYMDIIKVRYNNRFVMEKLVDRRILPCKMLKFILQPLIENAVTHGLEKKGGAGKVRISGDVDERGDLYFEIYDTGAGIEEEKLAAINRAMTKEGYDEGNFAISNICHRLKNAFGPEYGISLESAYGQWCKVKVRVGQIPTIN
jgi:two-component system sensor histidine kinase YesM